MHSPDAGEGIDGAVRHPEDRRKRNSTSRLRASDPGDVYDLVCVGFGPASLAIAVALHDALEAGTLRAAPRVLFLEQQSRFSWHAGMLLPGAKMQISFLKDLSTLRDPTSQFTFLNYLHQQGRLVEFTNLGTFLPARAEYEDYLRWCAGFFDDVVRYNSEALAVSREGTVSDGGPVDTFRVVSRDAKSGEVLTHRARNVILAIGGQPSIPLCLPSSHPRVIHSSQYAHLVPSILNNASAPYRVAVVGAGQSAAEIFNNIQVLYPNSRTWLVMRSAFLKPSDDSPFINSVFNPGYIDTLYPKPAQHRQSLLAEARSTNYGVVRLELIEQLYERLYHQRRELGSDERRWPHQIKGRRRVIRAKSVGDALQLVIQHEPLEGAGSGLGDEEFLDVDLIIAATGYRRTAHVDMLQDLASLLPEKPGDTEVTNDADNSGSSGDGWEVRSKSLDPDGVLSASTRILNVGRDYRVQFSPGAVAPGCGVWLQGCCEGTHGLSDTLLSVLATRAGEMVESIFGRNMGGQGAP